MNICMYVSVDLTDNSAYYGEGEVHEEEDGHHQSDGGYW